MPTIELTLPRPYPLQREIIDSPAKRKVVCAGRRVGKTTLAAYMAVNEMLKQRRVLLSSTSQDQADVFWRYINQWLFPLTLSGIAKKNASRRTIDLGQGHIHVKTGRNHDALRGDGISLLVLDECAYLDADAWQLVGVPMLADTNGTVVFISTPKRQNWFFRLYQQAVSDDTGRWAAWNFPSHANPYLTPEVMAALVEDMTEEGYAQEIEARFLEGQGAVFRYVAERCTAQRRAPYAGRFVAGLDWAMQSDYTAIVVMDTATQTVVDMDRFNGVDWALQRGRVRAMHDKWQLSEIVAESNSIGGPNIEALQREGLPVRAFETTTASKPPLIESLVLAFDRGEVTVLDDSVLRGELMAYERTVSATGRSQYSAPEGLHDDTVMALALAWHGITNSGRILVTDAPRDFMNYRG